MTDKPFDSSAQDRRFPPDDPREWLNRANSNLTKARSVPDIPEIYLEDLCFDAQQAAEKAIKAVLIWLQVRFPYTHDLALLLTLVEQTGEDVSESIRRAAALSDYAVETRYPGLAEPVTRQEYQKAVDIAEQVVHWAKNVIEREIEEEED